MHPTLLIGLDGATFTVLDKLMEEGVMPFMKGFVGSGVRAGLLSTPNPLTPPAWISLMTGRSPGHHGVFDFIWAEERKTNHYFTLYNYRDIRCETIWSIVSRNGGKVCSLNFPMMSPPPSVNGSIIPGLVSWKHLHLNVYPRELYEKIKGLPGFSARELAWDFNLEKKAAKGIRPEDYQHWVEFHISRERQWFEVVRYLMQHEPSDLTAILFDGLDKISHMGWRFLDPSLSSKFTSPWEQKVRDLCCQYFRELDEFLAQIVSMAPPGTRTIMASDHGFGPSWFVFRVNTWLEKEGYLVWKDLDSLDPNAKAGAQKVADDHFVMLDWDKTTAYARTLTSNGIYIRVAKEPGQTGVSSNQYDGFCMELTEKLLGLRHPETGERIVKRVLTKEEAYPGPNNAQAPDLNLVLQDHGFASILNKPEIIKQRDQVEGTHYPEGVFIANGPGICSGQTLPQLSILDVAPTVLYSLGLNIPEDFEKIVPDGVFESAYLKSNPCRIGEKTIPPGLDESAAKEKIDDAEDISDADKQVFKQLKALGYVE